MRHFVSDIWGTFFIVSSLKRRLQKNLTNYLFFPEHMWGTRVSFPDFFSTVETKISPVIIHDYMINFPKFICPSDFSRKTKCVDD